MQIIKIAKINLANDLFDISKKEINHNLVQSIRNNGVLAPVYLYQSAQEYCVLDGYLRLKIAQELALEEIPAIIVKDLSNQKLIELRLAFESDRLTLMAQVRLVKIASELIDDPFSFLARKELRAYIQLNRDIFDRLKTIGDSIPEIQQYYDRYNAPLANVISLLRQPQSLQHSLMEWAGEQRVRPVELDKLLIDIEDCAKLEKTSTIDLWNKITKLVNNSNSSKGQILNQFKSLIQKMRYPSLLSMRADCQAAANSLRTNFNVNVSFDPVFESDKIKVNFDINSLEQLDTYISQFKKDEVKRLIARILIND